MSPVASAVMATLGFMRMISASMFSSLKKPFFCATDTVKFGMLGMETAIRILSSASTSEPSSRSAASAIENLIVMLDSLAFFNDVLSFILLSMTLATAYSEGATLSNVQLVVGIGQRCSRFFEDARNYSNPYNVAGLSTKIFRLVVSSGANSASRSTKSPSLGVCPGAKLLEWGQSVPQITRSGAAAITARAKGIASTNGSPK